MKLLQRIKQFFFGPPRDTTWDEYIPAAERIEAGVHPEAIDHTPYIEEKRRNIRQYVEETNESEIRLNIDLVNRPYSGLKPVTLGTQKYINETAKETYLTHEQIEAASHCDTPNQD